MNKKRALFLIAALFIGASSVWAGADFTQLNDAGANSKTAVQGAIKGWMWVTALLPLGVSLFLFTKVKDWQERQEEQGQYQPKVAKYFSLILAAIGGIVIMYIVYGLFGMVFAGKDFSASWSSFVMDFYKSLI